MASLQFPWRFLGLAVVFLCGAVCCCAHVFEGDSRGKAKAEPEIRFLLPANFHIPLLFYYSSFHKQLPHSSFRWTDAPGYSPCVRNVPIIPWLILSPGFPVLYLRCRPAPVRNMYGFPAARAIRITDRLPAQTKDSLYVLHTAAAFLRTAFAALSTCEYSQRNGRVVVMAKKISQ